MDDLDNQEIGENPETEENFSKSELENEFFEKTLAEENATAKENIEETLTAENNANETTTYAQTAAENPPKSEPNFYAEESFYDTNPLPKPVQPQYFPNQQGYYQNGQQFQQGGYIPYGQPPFNNVQNQQYQQPFNPNMANPQQNYCQAPPPPNPYDQYAQTPVQGDFGVNTAENPPKKKTKAAVIITSIAVCVVALLLLIAFISAMFLQVNKKGKPSENDAPQISISDKEKPEINETPAENGEYSPEQMAAILSKSVVAVYSYDDNSLTSNVKEASGIILSENGYILTNAHVTVGTAMQKVRFEDGTEYIAKVIGEDVPTDIAVIKIEPKTPLVPAEFGSSEGLLQGQQVCAMGNAGGFINSFTVGHVSSPSRQVPDLDSKNMVSFIQTDAAVNPGNSGGALANMYGQVIGIVSAKFSVQGGYESIGFAISMDSAKPIIDDILDKGYVQNRPKVGIIYAPISEGDAKDLGVVKGLYVTTIAEDSDIKNTELQIYDIITEMNGVRVYDAETVQEALSGLNVGDVVKAKVYRKSIIDEVNEFEIEFKMVEDRG